MPTAVDSATIVKAFFETCGLEIGVVRVVFPCFSCFCCCSSRSLLTVSVMKADLRLFLLVNWCLVLLASLLGCLLLLESFLIVFGDLFLVCEGGIMKVPSFRAVYELSAVIDPSIPSCNTCDKCL